MPPGITFVELLDWIRHEIDAYERWISTRPDSVLAVPVGTDRTSTVRDLLFHVYVVDLRYGQRLHQMPVSPYESDAAADTMELFALARRGQNLLRLALDGSVELNTIIQFETLSAGMLRASGRKILAHTITHHIRHMSQIATALRQHGHATDWMHDLIMSNALD